MSANNNPPSAPPFQSRRSRTHSGGARLRAMACRRFAPRTETRNVIDCKRTRTHCYENEVWKMTFGRAQANIVTQTSFLQC
jgi:hypothetical protein